MFKQTRVAPMAVILQHEDGGREVLWDNYRSWELLMHDLEREFKRGYVGAVVYDKSTGIPLRSIVCTRINHKRQPEGYSKNGVEHWARPILAPNAVIVEDERGRRIEYR